MYFNMPVARNITVGRQTTLAVGVHNSGILARIVVTEDSRVIEDALNSEYTYKQENAYIHFPSM